MLEDENLVSKDMVQGDFLDSYNNLTLKSVWTIKWYLSQCNDSSVFLVKADDDLFLHLPKLVEILETISPRGVLRGILYQEPYVIRNPFDKWYALLSFSDIS
jgi:beta-1,3-galactosyltransferase 1